MKSTQEDCMSDANPAVTGAPADMPGTQDRHKKFQQLNRLLWLCWLGLPVWAGILYWRNAVAIPAALAGASPGPRNCLPLFLDPNEMTLTGKALYWSLFAFEISIFFILLFVLHRLVRKFASGRIFVSDTLTGLKSLGIILIVWPFIQATGRYLLQAALKAYQVIPSFWPLPFNVNFGIVAVGLFLLALKAVIENAIDIKTDNELTI
jgi:hypothetical protein